MGTPPITAETERRIALLFPPEDRETVRQLPVEQCGHNLPFLKHSSDVTMDRVRFAALKLSGGSMQRLHDVLELAMLDWRDVLIAAGFGQDPEAHNAWLPDQVERR